MIMSVQEKINLGDAVFKWVQHKPVGHLKDLSDDDLEMIRQQLIKEVREVGRALHWIDGIIKLKSLERTNNPATPVVPNPIKGARS
jgi:hypothetical protein